jgi:uncharacterized membrane protein YbjE (DUF340 family)
MTLKIVGAMAMGAICGHFFVDPAYLPYFESAADWGLRLLIFTVGLDLGSNENLGRQVKTLPKTALAIPFLIAVGSIIGAVGVNLILDSHPLEAAAVGGGFGWYSLSAVLIAQTYDVTLGALAFLTNIFREVLAIISIPWIAAKLGYLPAIAPGGATAMDVTLPIISQSTDQQTTLVAFYSGTVLTLMVPVLVPFLLKLARLFT